MKDLLQTPGVTIGEILGADGDGGPLVAGPRGESRAAEAVWMERTPDWAACAGLRCVLGRLDGDPARPVILGLLDAPPPATGEEAQVLKLSGEREVILQCGEAKISLRADGRVVIQGGYVLSRSTGVNKVKGASVQIN